MIPLLPRLLPLLATSPNLRTSRPWHLPNAFSSQTLTLNTPCSRRLSPWLHATPGRRGAAVVQDAIWGRSGKSSELLPEAVANVLSQQQGAPGGVRGGHCSQI